MKKACDKRLLSLGTKAYYALNVCACMCAFVGKDKKQERNGLAVMVLMGFTKWRM